MARTTLSSKILMASDQGSGFSRSLSKICGAAAGPAEQRTNHAEQQDPDA